MTVCQFGTIDSLERDIDNRAVVHKVVKAEFQDLAPVLFDRIMVRIWGRKVRNLQPDSPTPPNGNSLTIVEDWFSKIKDTINVRLT